MISKCRIDALGCRLTTVEALSTQEGVQVLKVRVEPGGEIPLHQHDCAATMVVVSGSARTLGKDGRLARKGDVVVKAANEPHGFVDITEPFCFISISEGGGIVR